MAAAPLTLAHCTRTRWAGISGSWCQIISPRKQSIIPAYARALQIVMENIRIISTEKGRSYRHRCIERTTRIKRLNYTDDPISTLMRVAGVSENFRWALSYRPNIFANHSIHFLHSVIPRIARLQRHDSSTYRRIEKSRAQQTTSFWSCRARTSRNGACNQGQQCTALGFCRAAEELGDVRGTGPCKA